MTSRLNPSPMIPAVHRITLHEETSRQLQQLQALYDIDKAINASLDLRFTLNVLLKYVAVQLGVDAAAVFLLHPHLNTLEFVAGRGFQTTAPGKISLRLGEAAAGRAALKRCTIHVRDPREALDQKHASLLEAEGFQGSVCVPLIAKGEVKGVLEVFHREEIQANSDWLHFLETMAGQAAIAVDNSRLFEDLQQLNLELVLAYDATIEGWSYALDLQDSETEGHSQRVTQLTLELAMKVGLAEAKLPHIRRGALLHDIGKMGIPDAILLKPGRLIDAEWEIMYRHPQLAHDMLSGIEYLHPALNIPYCHHEKWDGTGYPRRLKGEEIPMEARIFAVVDVYDALTSERPYRSLWSKEEALAYIQQEKDNHFDPQVVEIFLREMES